MTIEQDRHHSNILLSFFGKKPISSIPKKDIFDFCSEQKTSGLEHQKITDIYATSVDYDPTTGEKHRLFQNRSGQAAVGGNRHDGGGTHSYRADSSKPYMGLTTWREAKIRKQDVDIAKNYLSEKEFLALNNLVAHVLTLNEGNILKHVGSISHELALPRRNRNMISFIGSGRLKPGKK